MKHYGYLGSTISSVVNSRWGARISVSLPLAFTFTFCGCLSRPNLDEQTFAFSAPALLSTNGSANHRVLGIKSLQISPPFDARSFVYRTGEFAYERDPYARFLGLPAEQLAVPVSEILSRDGCFSEVVEADSAVKSDALVDITVSQLYGDIRNPKTPFAVLAMRVTFLEATNSLPGGLILQQDCSRRIPMTSTAPAALMAGWNRALVEILAEVASDFRGQAINERRHQDRGGNLSQK